MDNNRSYNKDIIASFASMSDEEFENYKKERINEIESLLLKNEEELRELQFQKMNLDSQRERLYARAKRGEDINSIMDEYKVVEESTKKHLETTVAKSLERKSFENMKDMLNKQTIEAIRANFTSEGKKQL